MKYWHNEIVQIFNFVVCNICLGLILSQERQEKSGKYVRESNFLGLADTLYFHPYVVLASKG